MTVLRLIPLAALGCLALAACGGSGHPRAAASPPPSPAAAVSCGDLQDAMVPVVADQASQDKDQTENWVGLVPAPGGGSDLTSQGVDLQIALRAVMDVTGSGELAGDARAFGNDAGAFLADQGDGLMPGWDTEYKPLEADIKAIGALCGYPGNTSPS